METEEQRLDREYQGIMTQLVKCAGECVDELDQQLLAECRALRNERRVLADECLELKRTIGQLEQEVQQERNRRQTVERELMWAQKRIVELESK